jgi:hypothetical protein
MKQVIVLVGPKGAGKTTIGRFLAAELGISFLDVEPLFLEVRSRLGPSHPDLERQGFESVLASLKDALMRCDSACFDSTGASVHFPWLQRIGVRSCIMTFCGLGTVPASKHEAERREER